MAGDQKFGSRVDLTPSVIKSLRPRARAYEVADRRVIGLRVVIYTTGNKSFAIRYPFNGRGRNLVLGPYPRLKIADARKLAARKLRDVHAGIDPAKEKSEKVKAEKSGSVAAAFELFNASHLVKKRSAREQRRIFNKYILPKVGKRPLVSITKSDVIDILKSISAPAMSNRTYSALSKFFRWCSAHDMIPAVPTSGVTKLHSESKGRDRIFSDREIVWWWRACELIGYPYGPLLKQCLLLGCREGEAANMKWSDFDWEYRLLKIPESKSGRARELHITKLVQVVFQSCRHEHDYVFGRKPPSGWSKAKKKFDRAVAEVALADFEQPPPHYVFHDARRTTRSTLARLGVRPEVAKAILGQAVVGMDRIYDRYQYTVEMKDALEKMADFVTGLVEINKAKL